MKKLVLPAVLCVTVTLTAVFMTGCGSLSKIFDFTAPKAERAEAYTITQPGTYVAKDYIVNIEDVNATEVGFLSFEKREDLHVMTDEEIAEAALDSVETKSFAKKTELKETVTVEEDGIYDSQIAVRDEAGNMLVLGYSFYVDGTPPVIEGQRDEDIETDENGRVNYEVTGITITDNFDGELYENEERTIQEIIDNQDRDGIAGTYTLKLTSVDRAGNTVEGESTIRLVNNYYIDNVIITEGYVENIAFIQEGLKKIPENVLQRFLLDDWHIVLTDQNLGAGVGGSTYWGTHEIVIPDAQGLNIPMIIVHEMGHYLGGATGIAWDEPEFAEIYAAEKDAFAATGGFNEMNAYNQMEFFSQVFCDSYTTGYAPTVAPRAYEFVQRCVASM